MFGLGGPELIVILVIGLVLFGSSKLPQLGSGLGKAIRDFRKGFAGIEDDLARKESNKKDKRNVASQHQRSGDR
jgi:sec-independent protein translocase protein TatA